MRGEELERASLSPGPPSTASIMTPWGTPGHQAVSHGLISPPVASLGSNFSLTRSFIHSFNKHLPSIYQEPSRDQLLEMPGGGGNNDSGPSYKKPAGRWERQTSDQATATRCRVCLLCSTRLPGGNLGYPHFTDEQTEPGKVKDLAQGHSAAK